MWGLLFIIAVLLIMLVITLLILRDTRAELDTEIEVQKVLRSSLDASFETNVELETERDILRSSVELERTRADANLAKGQELEADLRAAQFKLRMVRRAMDHDGNPVIVQSEA